MGLLGFATERNLAQTVNAAIWFGIMSLAIWTVVLSWMRHRGDIWEHRKEQVRREARLWARRRTKPTRRVHVILSVGAAGFAFAHEDQPRADGNEQQHDQFREHVDGDMRPATALIA
jgi:hypothetical protein